MSVSLRESTLYRGAYLAVSLAVLFLDQWTKGVSSKMDEPEWRLWGLAALALTWFLVRMAEVRQLRKMNRILISRA